MALHYQNCALHQFFQKELLQRVRIHEQEYQVTNLYTSYLLLYKSERKLCDLLEGLIDGVAEHFNEKISYKHVKCMKENDDNCILEIKFN